MMGLFCWLIGWLVVGCWLVGCGLLLLLLLLVAGCWLLVAGCWLLVAGCLVAGCGCGCGCCCGCCCCCCCCCLQIVIIPYPLLYNFQGCCFHGNYLLCASCDCVSGPYILKCQPQYSDCPDAWDKIALFLSVLSNLEQDLRMICMGASGVITALPFLKGSSNATYGDFRGFTLIMVSLFGLIL